MEWVTEFELKAEAIRARPWLRHSRRFNSVGTAINTFGNGLTGGATANGGGAANASGWTQGQLPQYNQQISNTLNPFIAAGQSALGQAQAAGAPGGFTAADFQSTMNPGYQFTLQQGQRATQQASGLQGSPQGGNALAALDQYTTGLANNTYQSAFNNWQTQVGNLTNIAGIGAGAGESLGGNLASLFGAGSGNVTQAGDTGTSTAGNFWGSIL